MTTAHCPRDREHPGDRTARRARRRPFRRRHGGCDRSFNSGANYLEAAIVVDSAGDPVASRRFDDLVTAAGISVVAVTPEHAQIARSAYRDFGKASSHPAQLNFGDCFACALAVSTRDPLLYKGDDVVPTDVTTVDTRSADTRGGTRSHDDPAGTFP